MSDTEYETPEAQNVDDRSGDIRIAFVGDSITAKADWAGWFPGLIVGNFGVSGDTTDDLLERIDEIVAFGPDEIVLLIGTNDLGTRQSVEHLVRNIETACVRLRRELPASRMLVQSVMPRGAEYAARLHMANIHLRQFASTVKAMFLDLWPALADGDEIRAEYSDDRLHLTDAGYQAWLGELRPALEILRDAPPMTTPIRIIAPDQFARPER